MQIKEWKGRIRKGRVGQRVSRTRGSVSDSMCLMPIALCLCSQILAHVHCLFPGTGSLFFWLVSENARLVCQLLSLLMNMHMLTGYVVFFLWERTRIIFSRWKRAMC
ncbi:hypothetical protein Goari_004047 [Gossypium aridum]|uniref:Uncharacterized protein n=1 Tax=Gossypium aridum TaxID=34290 RepID=A0A7J8Y320_GOSAI|nr:hypothetical protein [Gossypium aridum]